MPFASMRSVLPWLLLVPCFAPAGALAQPGEPALTPPRLLELAEPDYPDDLEGEATLVLDLTLDAGGTVTDARVVDPTGTPFDTVARDTLLRSRFAPARRATTPIPSRIRFRLALGTGPNATAPADAPGEEAPELHSDLSPMQVEGAELHSGVSPMQVEDGEGFGAVARVRRPAREAVRRTLEGEALTWVPGGGNDPLRALELLPGIGRPPFNGGLLLVRGASPHESQAFYGGMAVPLLFHFGGLTSFVQPPLIDRIDFYPGSFSVRYGRKVGGAVEVVPRDPATDRFRGEVDVDLIDTSFVAEGPLSDDLGVSAAARRSYVDFFFTEVVPEELFDVVAAPVYYDYQLALTWRPRPGDTVRAMLYGSSDRVSLVFADPPDTDPVVRGNVAVDTELHRLHVGWTRRLSDAVEQELSVAAGPTSLGLRLGDAVRLETDSLHVWTRAEWRVRLSHAVKLTAGWDALVSPFDVAYRGPVPRQSEGNFASAGPVTTEPGTEASPSGTLVHPALYVESALHPYRSLRLVLGLRLDWYSDIEEWSFDPRLVAVQSLGERTRVTLGAGLFSQPPSLQESAPGLGNPDLEPSQALHLGAGVEHELPAGFEVGADAFYKRLWRRVVSLPSGEPPYFSNDGTGRIFGLELYGRVPFARRLFGTFSYTLSRSERRDPDGRWRPFDYDQSHVLVGAFGWRLGRGWEAGAAFRLVSGNPYTPVEHGTLDLGHGVYVPTYGPVNSERNPWYHRLDVRVEKTWDFDAWRLALRLDVQNVYNAENREGLIHDYRFRERTDLPGLPILPSLGIRGQM